MSPELLVRGERISVIAFMSMSGMLDCKTVKHSVNGDTFYDSMQTTVLPHLMTFNGVNPHSVLIVDNSSIHHVDGIVQMVHEVGALIHFLPPYSPDYIPVEEAFSKVKANLRAMNSASFEDPENLVMAAFSTTTVENCQQWIGHAGIY